MRFSLKQIQNQPIEVRMRILWTLIVIIGIGLLVIWVYSTTNVISKSSDEKTEQIQTVNKEQSEQKYIEVESIEHKGGKLLVYFKVNNPTDNILVFSKSDSIILRAGDNNLTVTSLVNRQNGNFQQKILSHSESFGTAYFDDTAIQDVELTFSNLSFETDDNSLFNQKIQLDLEKLDKPL